MVEVTINSRIKLTQYKAPMGKWFLIYSKALILLILFIKGKPMNIIIKTGR